MSKGEDTAPPRDPGSRRRGRVLEQAIMRATLDQVRSLGYNGLTMEGVAAAAGTGKAALYRRWPNRDALVVAALTSSLPDPRAIRFSGDVRSDLLALLECLRDAIAEAQGSVFQGVREQVAEGGGLLHSVVGRRVMDPCRELLLGVLRTGVAEGELRPGAASEMVAAVGPAMIINYVVNTAPVVPGSYLVSIVDEVLLPLALR
jgi:AcrR family transcriptional regulator